MIKNFGCSYGNICLGGDPPAPTVMESTGSQMAALVQYLPDMVRVSSENMLPYEQARMNTSKVISPQENALALQMMQEYGPLLNRIGQDISRSNQLSAVQGDAAALNKAQESGLLTSALALQRQADPEFYAQRELMAKKSESLLNSFDDKGGLSPTELEEISRGLNRTNVNAGVDNVGSASAAVQNAMQFGAAGTAKKNALGNAIAQTAQNLQSTRSGFDPFQVATGRSAFQFPNVGQQQYQGNAQGLGQATNGFANNLLQQTGENQRAAMNINANRRDSLDRFGSTFGAVTGGLGSLAGGAAALSGCWVAREVYGIDNIRWLMFRRWLFESSPSWFLNFYLKHGEKFAVWISNKPKIKLVIRRWMDSRINA